MTAHFKKNDRWYEDIFNIFPRVLLERKDEHSIVRHRIAHRDARAADCRVPTEDHFSCYNYFFLQRLGTIGQAIYLRTFFPPREHIRTTAREKGLILQKRYDDICAESGGLTVHAKKSLIEREQLGAHLAQLVNVGFLSSYAIETAKSLRRLSSSPSARVPDFSP